MYNMPSDMRRRPKHQKSMYDTYMERKAKEVGGNYTLVIKPLEKE